jgi:hypothetical protein
MVKATNLPTHLDSDLQIAHLFNEQPAFQNALPKSLKKFKRRAFLPPHLPGMTFMLRRNPQVIILCPKLTKVKVKK